VSVQTARLLDKQVSVRSAVSHHAEAAGAIADLRGQLGDAADLYAIFVSPGYDLAAAGVAIGIWCDGRVIGCTSSGNIGPNGYESGGIAAVALAGGGLRAHTISLAPLTDLPRAVERAGAGLAELHAAWDGAADFGILLVDGLSMCEDKLVAQLMAALGDVPIIGGSAGDGLTFTDTAVYHEGRFESNVATLTVVTLEAPFRLFRLQHHEPTDQVLIATDTSPDRRLVRAFNGRPAAEVYAEAIGIDAAGLGPAIFCAHPLVLQAAGVSWIRSITAVHDDGSLSLLAAVDVGEVLRIGRSAGVVEKLADQFATLSDDLGGISGVLTFDCFLRRLEFEEHGLSTEVGEFLARNKAYGFSTYGEQFNGMHMNNTLVAVAFGGQQQSP
jgi:hypothetical protein